MNARSPADVRIGTRVRNFRLEAKLGQAELARRIGLRSATTMWRYENGATRIPVAKLSKIAQELSRSVDEILGSDAPSEFAPTGADLQRELIKLAHLASAAAHDGTPGSLQRFNAAVLEHASRIRPRR